MADDQRGDGPSSGAQYSGLAKRNVCNRLQQDWAALADVLGIPEHDRRSFDRKPEGVWEWLSQRDSLDRLPEALERIERFDLVNRLAADLALARRPHAMDKPTPPTQLTPSAPPPELVVPVSVRQALMAELAGVDLTAADWCLVASRTARLRELLDQFANEPPDGNGTAAGLAAALEALLETLAGEPGGSSDWQHVRQLRDALITALLDR